MTGATKRGVSELKLSKAQSPNISLKTTPTASSKLPTATTLNNNILNPLPSQIYLEEFNSTMAKKCKCAICGKEMENAIDSKTKEVSPYLWKTTCEHNKNLRLSRG